MQLKKLHNVMMKHTYLHTMISITILVMSIFFKTLFQSRNTAINYFSVSTR